MTARAAANGNGQGKPRLAAVGEPFDLDAAAAAAADEAETVPFAFTHNGETYEVPAQSTWPVRVLRDLGNGDLDSALGTLLGDKDYEKLLAADFTVGQMNALFEQVAKASGMGNLKNSPARQRPASTRT